jgi:hypothetical protein
MVAGRVASNRTRELALSTVDLVISEKQRSISIGSAVERKNKNKNKACADVSYLPLLLPVIDFRNLRDMES